MQKYIDINGKICYNYKNNDEKRNQLAAEDVGSFMLYQRKTYG